MRFGRRRTSANAGAAKQATAKAAHNIPSILSLVVVGLNLFVVVGLNLFFHGAVWFAQSYGLQQKRSITLPSLPPSAGYQ